MSLENNRSVGNPMGSSHTSEVGMAVTVSDFIRKKRKPTYEYPTQDCDGVSSGVPKLCCCYAYQVGRFYICCDSKGPRRWKGLKRLTCMVGPCWPMVIITPMVIVGAHVAVAVVFFHSLHVALFIPLSLSLVILLYTYFKTALSNPGIQPRFSTPQADDWKYHRASDSYRPPGTLLCSETHVLIKGVDHFCPWTGTTIGDNNIKHFHTFLYSLIFSLFVILICVLYGLNRKRML